MLYRHEIPKPIQKSIAKLDQKSQFRILRALDSLTRDPFCGKKLTGNLEGAWSIRAWPYRIIYIIDKSELIVVVLEVGHRQSVYK